MLKCGFLGKGMWRLKEKRRKCSPRLLAIILQSLPKSLSIYGRYATSTMYEL